MYLRPGGPGGIEFTRSLGTTFFVGAASFSLYRQIINVTFGYLVGSPGTVG
jgi:hypothetical protein